MGFFSFFKRKTPKPAPRTKPQAPTQAQPPSRPQPKPATTASPSVVATSAAAPDNKAILTAADISRLLPLRLLPARVIKYLAKQGKVSDFQAGAVIAKDTFARTPVYLLKGTLEFHCNGTLGQVIQDEDTNAAFPLPFEDADLDQVIVKTPARLVSFAQELVQNAERISIDKRQPDKARATSKLNSGVFTELLEDAKTGQLELPSAPDLGVRIGRAIDNPDASSDEIARIIQLDPALTARLIQVANSPLYSGLGKIANCTTAVTRLGMTTTRNLVISFLLKNLFRHHSKVLQRAMDDVWSQSTKVAAISSVLAKVTPKLDPGRALLAGLIHQIGAIAVINDAKRHPEISTDPEALDLAVKQLGTEIGAIILEQWNFGDDLVDVVRYSGDWMRDAGNEPSYTDLVMIARLHSQIGKPSMLHLPRLDLVPAFHKLALGHLSPRMSLVILDQSEKDIQEVEALLN